MNTIINMINTISILLFLVFISYEASAKPYTTLVAPIRKDASTSLYTMILNSHDNYLIDLSAPFSWQRCSSQHNTSSIGCFTTECIQAQYLSSTSCALPITNNPDQPCTCTVTPENPITKSCSLARLTSTNLTIHWADGSNPSSKTASSNTVLSCAPGSIFGSLPRDASGLASLSWAPLSLESQFSSNLNVVSNRFALCLPSSSSGRGVAFFGNGPYNLLPPTSFDASSFLSYTPFLRNPKSNDFFIGIKALSVGENSIPMSPFEGIKLSTAVPYTTLRSDIYKLLLDFFTKAMKGIPRTKKVKPFNACFNASAIGFSRVGLHVPQIDLEFADGKNWTIYGANSMKMVGKDSACFAFLDGGKSPEHSVVIGSFQMEDNFLLFDLDQSRLGFSSSLLFERISCGGFNFTSKV